MDARYPALFERMARVADVLKASEEDLAAIYPGMPLQHAVERVRALAPSATLLITRGKDGVQLIRGETMLEQPSFAVMVADTRSEEHTSELQSLMRNSYAVFCLKKKKQQ